MKAFITGVTGQDGSYLAEYLIEKGYEVHAILRRNSLFTTSRVDHLLSHSNFKTYYGDLIDTSNLHSLLNRIKPDEVYNLGAQSHVAVSFDMPEYTAEVDGMGSIRLLNALKDIGCGVRYYQASTSELFGGLPNTAPQSEQTPFYPKSPYGVAKLYSYWATVNYRESFGMHASNGILFNHESPRRGETFVTRKITRAVGRISQGLQDEIKLGNLNAIRDWGHAKDYVEAMWLMMQQPQPGDYVIASGETHSVRDFVEKAFSFVDVSIEWIGDGLNEKGIDKKTGKILVSIDPKYFRPSEVEYLHGDPTRANVKLGWNPKISFPEMVKEMVINDIKLAKQERLLHGV